MIEKKFATARLRVYVLCGHEIGRLAGRLPGQEFTDHTHDMTKQETNDSDK
jgi:hypothetical protein